MTSLALNRNQGNCPDCGGYVWWLRHATTGELAPIHMEPVSAGDVFVHDNTGKWSERLPHDGLRGHINHFAVCPKVAKEST